MPKIDFPEGGLNQFVATPIANSLDSLSRAKNNCYFNIPSGFAYTSFLNGLSDTINSYYARTKAIDSITKAIDKLFTNLQSNLETTSSNLPENIIDKRDRLVR